MQHSQKNLKWFLIGFVLLSINTGCSNFYKATQTSLGSTAERSKVIESLKQQNKYFVLRNGSQAYSMKNINLNADQKTLECMLDTLFYKHQLHLENGRNGKMKYLKQNQEDLAVLNEVHFYIEPDNAVQMGQHTLQLDKIQKIEVIEKDKKRTTNSYVLGAAGITVGSLVVVAGALALMISSITFW
jgi:hypothetical protein